jgi:hypothetical protein
MPESVYKIVVWLFGAKGGMHASPSTFGNSKSSTYVVKSGLKMCGWQPTAPSFLFKFSGTNLLRGIIVRLLINYQHNIGV